MNGPSDLVRNTDTLEKYFLKNDGMERSDYEKVYHILNNVRNANKSVIVTMRSEAKRMMRMRSECEANFARKKSCASLCEFMRVERFALFVDIIKFIHQ